MPDSCRLQSSQDRRLRVPFWSFRAVRTRVPFLIMLALTIEGLMRSNLNMAYVCMVDENYLEPQKLQANSTKEEIQLQCSDFNIMENVTRREYKGTLKWRSDQRSYLFSVFYIGGLVATLSTDKLNRKLGSSRLVLYGILVNVAGTMATPTVASLIGPLQLAVIRFFMGVGQGVLIPVMSVLITRWFPANERSTALAIATTGNQLSIILAMFVTAELCQFPFFGGWPAAFYIYGILGLFLAILWSLLMADCPNESRKVTPEERLVIMGSSRVGPITVKHHKTRWLPILSSSAIWSICASAFCHNFVVVGIVTYIPFYYKSVHNMSLTSNGLLSALTFLCQLISKILFATIADEIKKRKWLSPNKTTKLFNTIASLGIAIGLMVAASCDCTWRWTAITAICAAMSLLSGYIPGYTTSIVTIAPSQTSGIASFTRFWAQIGMALSPAIIGIVVRTGRLGEWRIIFVLMATLCVMSGLFFQYCGSATVQHWDMPCEKLTPPLLEENVFNSELSELKKKSKTDLETE